VSALVEGWINLRLVGVPMRTFDLKGLPLHKAQMHSTAYNCIGANDMHCCTLTRHDYAMRGTNIKEE
jgi:hypothetical protein